MSRHVSIDLIDTPHADLRDHTEEHVVGLASDIKRNGQIRALLVYPKPDGRYDLIGGHARLAALVSLGKREAPIDLHSTASSERAQVTAACSDNNHAEWSQRDKARAAWVRFPDETIQSIAEIAGVGKGTAERTRDELVEAGTIELSHAGKLPGADGKARPRTYKPRENPRAAAEAPPKADLSVLPEPEHNRAAALIDGPGIPPKPHAEKIVANLAEMSEPEREEIYELNETGDGRDRSLALTKAAKKPPASEPLSVGLDRVAIILGKCIKEADRHPDVAERLRAILAEIEHLNEQVYSRRAA